MGILQPDLTEALDMSSIDEGTYKGKITEAKPETAKSEKKTQMCVVKVELEVNGTKRVRKAYLPVAGEGAGGFDNLLRACHLDDLADQYKDKSVNPKPSFDTDQLVGQEVQVIISPELYQRKDQAGNNVGDPEVRDRIKGFLKA